MQANHTQEQTVFQPVTLSIVLENETEVKAFMMMCNYTPIVEAVDAAGLDLSPIFNMMPEGVYSPETWNKDIAVMAKALSNHPALRLDEEIIMEDMVTEQINEIVDALFPPAAEQMDTKGITCEISKDTDYKGTINVSDGRKYLYKIAGCGEAIRIQTMDGTPVTEVPTSKYGTYELLPADIEIIETVLSQIS